MDLVDAVLHAVNFMLPAMFVALFVTFLGRFSTKKRAAHVGFIAQSAINFMVCLAVLIVGLILTGRDGKMLTYLAMLAASATVQWILSGSWRK